jgi:hypothetical protein
MKTITRIFLALTMIALVACEIDTYTDVPDNELFVGTVFEIEGDFTRQNDFMLYFGFPKTFKVYESDVVLVYILWEQVTDNSGKTADVWRLLPQTVVLKEGILQYNYDFTQADVQIFLDGSIDLNTLLPAEALDQVFRIVVLPADFALKNSLDVSNYNLVIKSLGENIRRIEKIDLPVETKALHSNE